MIVGKGMVAGALKDIAGWDADILFSSGVSNSGERDINAFLKERNLITDYLEKLSPGSTFVYFSTTSIFDPSKAANPYIVHKQNIEKFLIDSNVNYLILRLPNLVGNSSNPHTLTNFFVNSIKSGRLISLHSRAIRHLIDVADLTSILSDVKDKYGKSRRIVNVETDKPLSAAQILNYLEQTLDMKAIVRVADDQQIEERIIRDNRSVNYIWKLGPDYHKFLFKKYYSS